MDESGVLMKRMRQPFEQIARTPVEQRVGELLGRSELSRRNAFQLAENPAMMRALPLAVLVGRGEFDPVLPRAGPRLKISDIGKRSSVRSCACAASSSSRSDAVCAAHKPGARAKAAMSVQTILLATRSLQPAIPWGDLTGGRIVHSGTLVSQNVPDDRHGSKELRVMRIESTQFHVATRVGVRRYSARRSRACALSRQKESDSGCATIVMADLRCPACTRPRERGSPDRRLTERRFFG
jgi:hypothetical protein